MTFSIGITAIFFLYMIFWIQIPGMLFTEILLPRRLKISTRLLAGFFIGFLYAATVYFNESILGVNGLLMLAGPITSFIAVMLYFQKGRPSFYNAGESFRWTGIIIFGFIYLASVLNFQLKYLGALSGESVQIYHDFLFHTGNIASLSRSFPAGDIRIEGLTFYYHYFYELIFAMCKHIFKMDALRVYLNGNALVCAWPLSLALMTIGERIRAGRMCTSNRFFFYCFGTLVSCIAILPINVVGGRLPISWMNNHLYGNGNAMGLALAITIVTVDVLVDVWYDKYDFKVMIALYLLASAATGFKGTTGILLVAITWAVFIVECFISKTFHVERMIYAGIMTLGFICTYLIVTVGLHPSGANNRAMKLSVAGTIGDNRVGQVFSKLGLDGAALPWAIIAVVLSVICIIGPCILAFVGFAYGKFKTLIKEQVIGDIFDWFVIGMVMMGVIGFVFVSVPGFSQVYFVITNAAFIFYGAMKYITESKHGFVFYVTFIFFVFGAIANAADLAYFCYDDMKQQTVFETEAGDRADLVSKDTLEAYLWLRDNTPEDSLVAVDRFSEELDYRSIYFYCSALSERQCYIEGYDYSDVDAKQVEAKLAMNEKFFSDNEAEASAAMDMNEINYLVVTKLGHPNYSAKCLKLSVAFENDEVTIYKYSSTGALSAVQ